MKHNISLGTPVSFLGNSTIYVVSDYNDLLGPCPKDCTVDHDCYDEPYIKVTEQIGHAFPVRNLSHIFNTQSGIGTKIDTNKVII